MTIGQVHLTEKYARYRLKDPKRFSSFRIKDIGRPKHTKIVVGRLKKSGKWETQSILVARNDYNKGLRVAFTEGKRPVIVRKKLKKVM